MVIYLGGRLSNAFSAARRPHRLCMSQLMTALRAMAGSSAMKNQSTMPRAARSSTSCTAVNAYSRTHRWRSSILIRNLWIWSRRSLIPLEERISLLDTALQSTSDSSNIRKAGSGHHADDRAAGRAGEGRQRLFESRLPQVRCASLSLRREELAMWIPTRYLPNVTLWFLSSPSLEHQLTSRTTELTASLVRIFLRGGGWIREHSHTIPHWMR